MQPERNDTASIPNHVLQLRLVGSVSNDLDRESIITNENVLRIRYDSLECQVAYAAQFN